MENFNISGIQQIGVGTENFTKSWNWYIEMFGIDTRILEDDTVAERMLPYTGGVPQKRHACIAVNVQGGGGFEIWQYSDRKPLKAAFTPEPGDIGICAAKLRCRDVKAFHQDISSKWKSVTEPSTLPDGTPCFYVMDLYGNYFQIVEKPEVFIDRSKLTGGMCGALVGVTDIDRSVKFYSEIFGYDVLKYDVKGEFPDLPGPRGRFRRVLLERSEPRRGAFSGLFMDDSIELVQSLDREPRKIYEGRFWGDPGFIQICYDVTGMKALGRFVASKGHPFTVDSCPAGEVFDMGEASGHFTYIEDPDGTLIEFVETGKVPIIRKLGLVIDMSKRDPLRPLPKILFRLMGKLMKQKPINE